LADRVLLVATYYRTNLTMRQLAPLFGVKTAAVHRIIDRLGPFLALAPARRRYGPDTSDCTSFRGSAGGNSAS
jgi:Helix-turn-helix of DDE superfamily endonuclease